MSDIDTIKEIIRRYNYPTPAEQAADAMHARRERSRAFLYHRADRHDWDIPRQVRVDVIRRCMVESDKGDPKLKCEACGVVKPGRARFDMHHEFYRIDILGTFDDDKLERVPFKDGGRSSHVKGKETAADLLLLCPECHANKHPRPSWA